MQALVWPPRGPADEHNRGIPGMPHLIVRVLPSGTADPSVVLTKWREPNGKNNFIMWTRKIIGYEDDGKLPVWEYTDGLEFRHYRNSAHEAFSNRVKEILNEHEALKGTE